MKPSRIILLLSAVLFICCRMSASDGNVVISRMTETYTLKAGKNGRLGEVRAVTSRTYEARRADGRVLACEFYSSETPITKATAPGVKPVYKSMESGNMFFTGSRICAFPLELKKGKPVTVRFEKNYEALEQFGTIPVAETAFVLQGRYEVIVPQSLAGVIAVEACDLPATASFTTSTDKSGNIVYAVDVTDLPLFEDEDYAAPAISTAPRMIVSGMFPTISDLYAFNRSHIDDSEPESEVAELARSITASCGDDLGRIDAIASWVRQNIRYVGIEHGDYGKRPDSAGNVLAKRFGDCKGSANLIRQMMRACGIDGRLVWIGTRGDVIGPFSRYKAFGCANHMIAAAVINDSIVYVDGTLSFAPRRFIPYHIAGQEAIVEAGDSCLLTTLPPYDADRYVTETTGRFAIDGKCLTGDIAMKLRGHDRMMFENTITSLNTNKRTSFCQVYLAQTKSATYTDITNSTDAPDADVTLLTARESDSKAVVPAGSKLYVSLHPLRNWLLTPVDTDGRRRQVSTGTPYSMSTSMTLEIPEGYAVGRLPEDTDIDNVWFNGSMRYRREGNTVTVTGTLRGVATEAPLADIAAWNEAVKEISRVNNDAIILISDN